MWTSVSCKEKKSVLARQIKKSRKKKEGKNGFKCERSSKKSAKSEVEVWSWTGNRQSNNKLDVKEK